MDKLEKLHAFYGEGRELDRLAKGIGPLEFARTKELIARFAPASPAVVYDIGGAHGAYAFWLAGLGYRVHLLDAVPLHIEHARTRAAEAGTPELAGIECGDARKLPFTDESTDVIILHGPLYHLTERSDRLAALSEARRVLRPGGLLLAFTITNYASLIVGITEACVLNGDYLAMCEGEVAAGEHRRPASWPSLFDDGHFHHPHWLIGELGEAEFHCTEVIGVEGPGWMMPAFAGCWKDDERREAIIRIARMTEKEPVLSPHNMAVARRL